MLKSMKMVKVLSQLTEEYPHGCNVGKYLMVESWRKLWLHFKLGISDKYREEEKRLEEYRRKCKDEAIDMLKQYFYDLWD